MKLKVNKQWHLINTVLAFAVVAIQAKTLIDHTFWVQGTDQVLGHVDDIRATNRVRVMFYSYTVNGQEFHDEATQRQGHLIGPIWITYAKARPSLSVLDPGDIQSQYWGSLGLCIAGCVPFIGMWIVEFRNWRKGRE